MGWILVSEAKHLRSQILVLFVHVDTCTLVNTTIMLYAAVFLIILWNSFTLSIVYEHLCGKTESLIFSLQGLTLCHGSVANACTYLKAWRERNCAAHVCKQIKVSIPAVWSPGERFLASDILEISEIIKCLGMKTEGNF